MLGCWLCSQLTCEEVRKVKLGEKTTSSREAVTLPVGSPASWGKRELVKAVVIVVVVVVLIHVWVAVDMRCLVSISSFPLTFS